MNIHVTKEKRFFPLNYALRLLIHDKSPQVAFVILCEHISHEKAPELD